MPCPMRFGPAAEDHDLASIVRLRFAERLERPVHVGRERLELRRARVDALVGGDQPEILTLCRGSRPRRRRDAGQLLIAEAGSLQRQQQIRRTCRAGPTSCAVFFSSTISANCCRNQRSIVRQLVQRLDRPAALERLEDAPTCADRSAPTSLLRSAASSKSSSSLSGVNRRPGCARARATGCP